MRAASAARSVPGVDRHAGQHRHPGRRHQRLGLGLRAHGRDRLRRRPDEREPGRRAVAGEPGVLREEPVAGVDGVGAGGAGGRDEQVAAQVGVGGGGAGQPDGLVGERDVGQRRRRRRRTRRRWRCPARGRCGTRGRRSPRGWPPAACAIIAHIRKTPKPRRPATVCGVDGRQRDAEHGAGVAGVDDAVVVEPGGDGERVGLGLDLRLDRGGAGAVGVLVERPALRRGRRPADDRQHPRELRRPHDRELGPRPGEHQPRVVGPPGHAVVARAERARHVDREVRHRAVGDGVDHLGAVLDDPALLVLGADHVAGGVLQEDQRGVGLVGQQDELGGLLGLLAEQHAAVVGEHADRIAVQPGPAGDQRRAVARLVLVELGAVDGAGQHLAGVERHLGVGREDAEDLLGVVARARPGGPAAGRACAS